MREPFFAKDNEKRWRRGEKKTKQEWSKGVHPLRAGLAWRGVDGREEKGGNLWGQTGSTQTGGSSLWKKKGSKEGLGGVGGEKGVGWFDKWEETGDECLKR